MKRVLQRNEVNGFPACIGRGHSGKSEQAINKKCKPIIDQLLELIK